MKACFSAAQLSDSHVAVAALLNSAIYIHSFVSPWLLLTVGSRKLLLMNVHVPTARVSIPHS